MRICLELQWIVEQKRCPYHLLCLKPGPYLVHVRCLEQWASRALGIAEFSAHCHN